MTDEQIIKALAKHIDRAEMCKYGATKSVIVDAELLKNAVELICRQQAEINHFAEVNKMVIEPKTVKTEDEILRLFVNQSVKFIPRNDDIKAIQRDAVINFAERLNAEFENFAKEVYFGTTYTLVGKGVVNRVANEMFPKGSDTE